MKDGFGKSKFVYITKSECSSRYYSNRYFNSQIQERAWQYWGRDSPHRGAEFPTGPQQPEAPARAAGCRREVESKNSDAACSPKILFLL